MSDQSARHHADAQQTARWRFAFGTLLTFSATMATLAPFAIGVLGPFVVDEFELTNTSFGALGTAFFAVAGFGSLVIAFGVDRVDPRTSFLASFAISSLCLGLLAAAPNYAALLGAMAIGGVGAALLHPVTNLLIRIHLPPGSRGLIMGLKQSGVQLGAALAGAVLPVASRWLGWRWSLAALAVPALLALFVARAVVPTSDRTTARSTAVRLGAAAASLRWLGPFALLMGFGASTFGMYVVRYAVEDLGIDVAVAGFIATFAGVTSVISRITWAAVAERVATISAIMALLPVLAGGAIVLLISADAAGPMLVWAAAGLFGASGTAWNGVAHLAIVSETPETQTGQASSYLQVAFFAGLLSGPVAFGAILDRVASYGSAWSTLIGAYVLAAALAGSWFWHDRRDARTGALAT